MVDKFWSRTDEWIQYAPCFDLRDFTSPPARDDGGPVADVWLVASMCAGCTVRPECARTAYLEQWHGVWSCGVWIPGHDEDKREAAKLRQQLFDSIDSELEARGEDV